MNKVLIVLGFIISLISCSESEKSKLKSSSQKMDLSFIDNRKVKYSIVIMACDTCEPIESKGYRVVVDLTNDQKKLARTLDNASWIKLLKHSSSDFAANLILYQLYDRNASLFLEDYQQNEWRKFDKQKDLEFWRSEFAKQ